jgi:hypothetical protein
MWAASTRKDRSNVHCISALLAVTSYNQGDAMECYTSKMQHQQNATPECGRSCTACDSTLLQLFTFQSTEQTSTPACNLLLPFRTVP